MPTTSSTPRESWLGRAWRALTAPGETELSPKIDTSTRPPLIKAVKASKELKLVDKAIRDGRQELPPTKGRNLGEVEEEIKNYVESRRAEQQKYIECQANQKVADLQGKIEQMTARNDVARAEKISDEGIDRLKRKRDAANQELAKLRDRVNSEDEKRKRYAAPNFVQFVGIIFVAMALNAIFLFPQISGNEDSEFFQTSGIILINTIFGIVSGHWVPVILRYWSLWVKLLSIAIFALIAYLVIGLNLFINNLLNGFSSYGEFVDLLVDIMNLIFAMIQNSSQNTEKLSWEFAGIGGVCALLAATSMYRYRRYEAAVKAWSEAKGRLDERTEDYSNELQDIFDDKIAELEDLRKEVAKVPKLVGKKIEAVKTSLQELKVDHAKSRDEVRKLGKDLLSIYWEENDKSRSTPRPKRWENESFPLKRVSLSLPDVHVKPPSPDTIADQAINSRGDNLQRFHQEMERSIRSAESPAT